MATRSRPVAVVVTVGSTTILQSSQNRVGLYLSPPTAGRYSIAFGEAAVLDAGLTINAGDHIHIVRLRDVGPDLQQSVNVIGSAGFNVGWLEIYGN